MLLFFQTFRKENMKIYEIKGRSKTESQAKEIIDLKRRLEKVEKELEFKKAQMVKL